MRMQDRLISRLGLILALIMIPIASAGEITDCATISSAGNDSGYYYLSGNITGGNQTDGIGTVSCILINTSDIRLNCQGNTINGNTSAGYTLNIDGSGPLTNVSIENCRVTGTNSGVVQSSLQYSNFSNNTIAVSGTYAMTTSATGYNNYTNNVIPAGTSYYGIFHSISVGPSNFFNNNISSEYGLFLNGVSNQVVNGGTYNVGVATAIELAGSSNNIIGNLTATSIFGIGVRINGGSENRLDNISASGQNTALSITNTNGNTFTNLSVVGTPIGFFIGTANNNTISNSSIINSSDTGISLHLGANNNITHNTIEGSGNYGIQSSENLTVIANNTFNNNGAVVGSSGAAIRLNGSQEANISQNTINSTTGYGIMQENQTSESILQITNNTIENSSVGAIGFLSQLNSGTISYNTIRNNPTGIYLNVSSQGTNFANGIVYQNTIENATTRGIYSNYNTTNITNNTITEAVLGLVIVNSSSAILNSNHYYNNTNDVEINNNATSITNATNETFDNPLGNSVNFTRLDFYHEPTATESIRIGWTNTNATEPNEANSVSNKYINITNLTTTATINSLSFDYSEVDQTNETSFTIFRYSSGSWTSITTSVNQTNNKATVTNITSFGTFGLFDYQPAEVEEEEITQSSSSSASQRKQYQVTHQSNCSQNLVTVTSQRSNSNQAYLFIMQGENIVAEGPEDEQGHFRYNLSSVEPVMVRIGASKFFGPFEIENCIQNQTQQIVQNQSQEIEQNQETEIEPNQPITTPAPQQTIEPPKEEEKINSTSANPPQTNQINDKNQTIEAEEPNNKVGSSWIVGLILIILIVIGGVIYLINLRKK